MNLIEIHKQEWFPNFLRDQVTDALQFILNAADIYKKSLSRLALVFRACGTTRVLELCYGEQKANMLFWFGYRDPETRRCSAHLNYSEDEWNRVDTMIKAAEKAIREDHQKRHECDSIELNWTPMRGI
jgi:hypothetical protein